MASIQGTFPTAKMAAIPICGPPYARGKGLRFSGVDLLKIRYRTNGATVRALIPEQLTLEEQPIVTTWILDYQFSPIGPYKELIHQVEVTFNGTKYDYAILLVLDNEDAVYGGREQFGYPKVLGVVDFDLKKKAGTSAFIQGSVSRPEGNPIIEFLFKPSNFLGSGPIPPPEKRGLNLRLIPNVLVGSAPNVRQFIPIGFYPIEGERWDGVGSVKLPSTSEFDPLHKMPVVEYLSAELIRNATCGFDRVTEVFDF